MFDGMARENLRGTVLISAVLAALTAGTTAVIAQVDEPPGARFQTESNREAQGVSAIPSPYTVRRHSPEIRGLQRPRAYAYSPRHVIIHRRAYR
jgi:hypothetical protein